LYQTCYLEYSIIGARNILVSEPPHHQSLPIANFSFDFLQIPKTFPLDFPSNLGPKHILTRMGKADAVDQQLADLTAAIGKVLDKLDLSSEVQQQHGAQLDRLDGLRPVIEDLLEWRPYLEQSVRDLRQDLGNLRSHVADL
jgi:hypothetical protein